MKAISQQKKLDILAALDKGLSLRNIAQRMSVGYGTVRRVSKRERRNRFMSNGGRPKAISKALSRVCIRSIASGQANTTVDVQQQLAKDYDVHVTSETVRNLLKKNGLKARVKAKKPFLSQRHRRLRLDFAKRYENWTVEDWRRVVFSDETKVNRFGSDGRKWVWKKPGSPVRSNHVLPTLKYGGGSMMVWSCFSAKGVGRLVLIESKLNAALYVDILKDDLLGSLEDLSLEKEDIVFQHDNDPKHTAKITNKLLDDEKIDVLEWPPQSPDLNPIENLWASFKFRLAAYDRPPSSIQELWERSQEVWFKFTKGNCTRLVDSIPGRITAVIKAKGGHTEF
jgi:transposase